MRVTAATNDSGRSSTTTAVTRFSGDDRRSTVRGAAAVGPSARSDARGGRTPGRCGPLRPSASKVIGRGHAGIQPGVQTLEGVLPADVRAVGNWNTLGVRAVVASWDRDERDWWFDPQRGIDDPAEVGRLAGASRRARLSNSCSNWVSRALSSIPPARAELMTSFGVDALGLALAPVRGRRSAPGSPRR